MSCDVHPDEMLYPYYYTLYCQGDFIHKVTFSIDLRIADFSADKYRRICWIEWENQRVFTSGGGQRIPAADQRVKKSHLMTRYASVDL
jgi:hypothetical protein